MISKEKILKWKHDEEFQLEAVKHDGFAIQFINNPSEKVKLEAVKDYGMSIRFINNPSFEMCHEALKNTEREGLNLLIKFIDIEKYPELYEKYCFIRR